SRAVSRACDQPLASCGRRAGMGCDAAAWGNPMTEPSEDGLRKEAGASRPQQEPSRFASRPDSTPQGFRAFFCDNQPAMVESGEIERRFSEAFHPGSVGQESSVSSPGSVTVWIEQLRAGDSAAAERLWEGYYRRLVRLARHKLLGRPRAAADEEDVALSAFD